MTQVFADIATARRVLDPTCFELIVLPTEHCNFRCSYCYEDFSIGKMKRPIVEGLKELIAERVHDLDKLYISWFGGEPLLATSIILEVTSFARDLFVSNGKQFGSGMTTNGYRLSSQRFLELSRAGVERYQISLDGPRQIHDKTRLRSDGAGTFDRIWGNLISIAALLEDKECPKFQITLAYSL